MSLLPTAPPPTTEDIENLQAEIDSNSEHMSLLGAFYLNDALSSPSSTLNTLTQALGNVSHSFSQATLMRLQPCVIKKIYISMNGPGEFTSGSARWRLWRNAVRTGTEAFDTGNKSNASFTYALDNQLSQWYDVDIAMTSESDYLTAQFVASSLTGGPEGIYMQLWGSRT